jgi:hypothetical protein
MEIRRLGGKLVRSEHLFAGGPWLIHRSDNVPWSSLARVPRVIFITSDHQAMTDAKKCQ